MQDLPNGGGGGGAHPEPRRRQPCRPMRQRVVVLIRGGGAGADASIGPRALETLGTPLTWGSEFTNHWAGDSGVRNPPIIGWETEKFRNTDTHPNHISLIPFNIKKNRYLLVPFLSVTPNPCTNDHFCAWDVTIQHSPNSVTA